MATFNSTEYAAIATLGVMGMSRDHNAKVKRFPFNVTILATFGAAPVLRLTKIPLGAKHPFVYYETNGLSASAGVGLTVSIGDSDAVARLMVALDSSAAVQKLGVAAAGAGYEYTAETTIIATVNTGKTPVTDQKIWGFIEVCIGD